MRPGPGWSAIASADGMPGIPLRMHLMISAWDTVVESELEWLGLAAQMLESESILAGPLLHPSGRLGARDADPVVADDVALELDERGVPGADHRLPASACPTWPGSSASTAASSHARSGSPRWPRPRGRCTVPRRPPRPGLVTAMTILPGGERVLHRLALALEVRDALTSRPVTAPVAVRRRGAHGASSPDSPAAGVSCCGSARAPARRPTLRITDVTRQVVPRRFRIFRCGRLAEVEAADEQPPAAVHPGPVARAPGLALAGVRHGWPGPGFTVIRGRVARGTAAGPLAPDRGARAGGVIVGRAHGDDRGEFLLPVTGSGAMPPPFPSQIDVDLLVYARGPGGPPPPTPQELALDPLADLPVEAVPRSSSPPLPADLDNPLLRGESLPPFYVTSTAPVPIAGRGHRRPPAAADTPAVQPLNTRDPFRPEGAPHMPEYLTPGVYVEETSFRSKSIEGVPTSTFGMAGLTRYGPLPYVLPDGTSVPMMPTLVTCYAEFERAFGDLSSPSDDGKPNYLAHSARAFFANGGQRLYVARVFPWVRDTTATSTRRGSTPRSPAAPSPRPAGAGARLALPTWRARWPGSAGRQIKVTVARRLGRDRIVVDTVNGQAVAAAGRGRASSPAVVVAAPRHAAGAGGRIDPATVFIVRRGADRVLGFDDGQGGVTPIDPRDVGLPARAGRHRRLRGRPLGHLYPARPAQGPSAVGVPRAARRGPGRRPGADLPAARLHRGAARARAGPGRAHAGQLAAALLAAASSGYLTDGTNGNDGINLAPDDLLGTRAGRRRPVAAGTGPERAGRDRRHRDRRHARHRSGWTTPARSRPPRTT